MRTLIAATAALLLLAAAGLARAGDLTVRSDLPLWTEGLLPEHLVIDGEIGCGSHVRWGTWTPVLPTGKDLKSSDLPVFQLDNYGVFHCAYLYKVGWGGETPDFVGYAWIKEVGLVTVGGVRKRLMILQVGSQGGSSYEALLSNEKGAVRELQALDLKCPRANVRDAGNIDIWMTRYCAVNDRRTLVRLAREAAARPPTATYRLVPEDPDPEASVAEVAPN